MKVQQVRTDKMLLRREVENFEDKHEELEALLGRKRCLYRKETS